MRRGFVRPAENSGSWSDDEKDYGGYLRAIFVNSVCTKLQLHAPESALSSAFLAIEYARPARTCRRLIA